MLALAVAATTGCSTDEYQTALVLEVGSSVPIDCVSVIVTPEAGGPEGVELEVPEWAEEPGSDPLRVAVYPGGRIGAEVLVEAYGKIGGCLGEVVADLGSEGPVVLWFEPEETPVHPLMLLALQPEHGGPEGHDDCDSDSPARPDLCPCKDGESRRCFTLGPKEMADMGECRWGESVCRKGIWGTCEGQVGPSREQCNGKDDSCDGVIDSPWLLPREPCARDQGVCAGSTKPCAWVFDEHGEIVDGYFAPCTEETYTEHSGGLYNPEGDLCYGLDNDCDGRVDYGCPCNPLVDEPRPCYSYGQGMADPTLGVGICRTGIQSCIDPEDGNLPGWGPCEGEVGPDPREVCDGEDSTCSGTVDDPLPDIGEPCDAEAMGTCREGTIRCLPDDQVLERDDLGRVCLPSEPAEVDDLCDGIDATCRFATDDEVAICPEPGDLCCSSQCHPPSSLVHCGTCGNDCEDPGDQCQRAICREGHCTTTSRSDGTSCNENGGRVCYSGSCVFQCYIGGSPYQDGTTNSGNDCLICRPNVDPFNWTDRQSGSSCSGTDGDAGTCVEGSCQRSCTAPWGDTVLHDQTIHAFQTTEVGCYESCTEVRQSRRCVDGTLLGSYENRNCQPVCQSCQTQTRTWGDHSCQASFSGGVHGVDRTRLNTTDGRTGTATFQCDDGTWALQDGSCDPDDCDLPWGGQISHGDSAIAYQTSSVACGGSCAQETRSCSYGVLSGSYEHGSCAPNCADCTTQTLSWDSTHDCEASFETTSHDTSRTAENTVTGRSGSATHYCNDGTWQLQDDSTCSPNPCSTPWPAGISIPHGDNVTAYEEPTVGCEQTCSSEIRDCSYGILSGSFTNETCSVTTCGTNQTCHEGVCRNECTLPWDGTIDHGLSVIAYQSSTVDCEETCVSEERTCNDGDLEGSYTHQTCTVEDCEGCPGGTVSWGSDPVCEQTIMAGDHGDVELVTKTGNPQGEATFECTKGAWVLQPDYICNPQGG